MDRLLERQSAIQRALAGKHLQGGQLVLYDLTSSYFEGEYADSDLVTFGYNRDGKKGHEQIVIGLLCNSEGCPLGTEVFRGNTKDSTMSSPTEVDGGTIDPDHGG
jgi:transposase